MHETGVGVLGPGKPGDQSDEKAAEDADSSAAGSGYGTFPVYLRFRNTIMSGTNPDGSHYSDPVSFVSYFNGGDAVHYFPRGGYGYRRAWAVSNCLTARQSGPTRS